MKKTLITLILLFLLLIGCGDADFSREHVIEQEEFNPYFIIIGHPHYVLDYAGNKQQVNSYNIYMEAVSPAGENIADVKGEIYAVNFHNYAETLYKNVNAPKPMPISAEIVTAMDVAGNGFKEIYGRFYYNIAGETRRHVFSEPVLERTDDNVAPDDYSEIWEEEGFYLRIACDDAGDEYLFGFTIEFNGQSRRHLDLQTWLFSPVYGSYPFFGIYGYAGRDEKLTYANLPADKDFYFSSIYVRANFWREEMKTTVLYRFDIA